MRSRLVAGLVAAALVLAGCGGDSSALDDIEVTGDKTPKVEVSEFSTETTETKVLEEGDGPTVGADDSVSVKYLVVNGTTGDEVDNSFTADRASTVSLSSSTILPGFKKGLEGQKIGSRVLVAVAPEDGTEVLQDPSMLNLKKTDTMVFVFDLIELIPTKLEGGTEKKAPASAPQLTLEDDQPTGFAKGDKTPKKLEKSQVHTLIEGDGDDLAEGDNLTVSYLGASWPDGDVFNNSYPTGAPVSNFVIGGLITCFNDLLPGVTVGSRVVLECAEKDAYPDAQEGEPAGPLVFVVDILAKG